MLRHCLTDEEWDGIIDVSIAGLEMRWDVVHALLRRTNLYEVRHRRLGSFSGGSMLGL